MLIELKGKDLKVNLMTPVGSHPILGCYLGIEDHHWIAKQSSL